MSGLSQDCHETAIRCPWHVSRAIGPALAGVIIAASGPVFVFLVNAASFLGVLLALVRWRPHETT